MRHNIFNRAHLPLKTALLTGCISLTNHKAHYPPEICEIVNKALDTYKEQISYEAFHVMPLIFEYEPSIANNYTTDHQQITRAAKNLNGLLQSYQLQQKNNPTPNLLQAINKTYDEFVLLNYHHMDDEEAVLNEILWRYYNDNVLKQTEEKMNILPHLLNKSAEKRGFQFANAA